MSKINTPPIGLQFLLGNVNMGENPAELDQSVRPGVDLLPFWGVQRLRTRFVAANVVKTVGQGINMIVPDGEMWIPLAVSGSTFLRTTERGRLQITISSPNSGVTPALGVSDTITAGTGTEEITAEHVFSQRFLMGADYRFRCSWQGTDGGVADSMSIDLLYYSLEV